MGKCCVAILAGKIMVLHGIWPKTTQVVLAAGAVFVMEETYNIADKRLTQKPTF